MDTNWEYVYIVFLTLGGAMGGFIAAFRHPSLNEFHPPFSRDTWTLGSFGDILVGVVAAFVGSAFLNIFPKKNLDQFDVETVIQFIGWGAVAGYSGIAVLDRASAELFRTKQNELAKKVQAVGLIDEGRDFLAKGHYDSALEVSKQALQLDPANEQAKISMAVAQSYLDPNNHEQPIQMLNEVIQTNPNSARAYYNLACIKALNPSQYPNDQILADLQKAVAMDKSYKIRANVDPDLKAVSGLAEFKQIIG